MTETDADPTLVLDVPTGPPGRSAAKEVLRAVLRAPIEARTWKEFVYVFTVFALGCVAIAYLFFGFLGGLYASIFIIGLWVLALVILGGRTWGRIYRALCRDLLGMPVVAPPRFAPRPGPFGFLRSAFTDRASWRAILFLFAQAVLGVVVGYFVLVAIAVVLFTAISPIPWALLHPTNVDENGVEHHSLFQFGSLYIDSWPKVLLTSAIGIICCFALPWLLRGTCWLHRALTITLLAATARDTQVAELQASRKAAVENAADTLRRVERDLHDGTQARLVTIAMALGRAEERLAVGGDPRDLIADAHASSKEALTELRELVRGIHPPALELGLAPALETLAARCAVPVELRVHLPERPHPAIEAIAYFSVAELLTNVVKHAHADRIWVSVVPTDIRTIVVTVRDNGIGGVLPPTDGNHFAGSGLAGLSARARAVDGTLTVQSPTGGPTVVTILLPKAGPQ
ncbi:sensor histidine kinase [Nocardia sp. GCM10030253]|uniref:sensor histidine kinase n=1 Tax=Nocardia sp. GCM10030253 TaxID=3273404 RepID=UPI003629A5DD